MTTPESFDAPLEDASKRHKHSTEYGQGVMKEYSQGVKEFGDLVEDMGNRNAADAAANWVAVPPYTPPGEPLPQEGVLNLTKSMEVNGEDK